MTGALIGLALVGAAAAFAWGRWSVTGTVVVVEVRQGAGKRWRWYGLDRTGSVVCQCAGNWLNTQGAFAAGRTVFPLAMQRVQGEAFPPRPDLCPAPPPPPKPVAP